MNLDSIKLLDGEPSATDIEVDEYIEHLVQQGSGWGMRQLDRIFLTVARTALEGKAAIEKLDETQRALKGQQLENGRVRKRLENAEAELAALRRDNERLDKGE